MATLHANGALDTLDKLVGYCVLAGQNVVVEYVRDALASVTDLVVFLRRTPAGRRVDEVIAVGSSWASSWEHEVIYATGSP